MAKINGGDVAGSVCLHEGTLTLTPMGPRRIKDVAASDLFTTFDAGTQSTNTPHPLVREYPLPGIPCRLLAFPQTV